MTATMVLISTVLPSGTLISVRTPAAGEGISASTLSVEISKRGSSRATVSPTFFSHLVMVPSKMDSPICGMTTSVPPEVCAGADALTGGGGVAGAGSDLAAVGAGTGSFAFSGAVATASCLASFLASTVDAGVDAAAFPFSAITATTVLISTVAPSAILISVRTPAAGEGISASTLSVEISNKGSSRSTVSPAFFSHFVIVPSKIDSPICGITTLVGMDSFLLSIRLQISLVSNHLYGA